MNILLVTPYFVPQTGGVVTFVDLLHRLLRQRGHHVYVLVPGSSHAIQATTSDPDAPLTFYMRLPWVREAPIKGLLGFLAHFIPTLWRLRRFLREREIDIVSLEYPMPYMYYFYVLRRIARFRIVVGIHGSDVLSLNLAPRYEQWLVRRIIRAADCLLAHSASLMSHTETEVRGLPTSRHHIPYGIDPDDLRATAKCASPRNTVVVAKPYILTVAKLHPRKGLDVLIHAVKKLGAMVDGYRFVIAGDGPAENHLKELTSSLGLADQVLFTGALPREEIAKWCQECEFFVLPSRSEPFGIALLEAMAFEKAVIATRVGDIPQFVFDGHNGVLVPAEDRDALAGAILRLVGDRDLRDQLGRNGKKAVEEKYRNDVIIGQYESLFASVSTESRSLMTHGGAAI